MTQNIKLRGGCLILLAWGLFAGSVSAQEAPEIDVNQLKQQLQQARGPQDEPKGGGDIGFQETQEIEKIRDELLDEERKILQQIQPADAGVAVKRQVPQQPATAQQRKDSGTGSTRNDGFESQEIGTLRSQATGLKNNLSKAQQRINKLEAELKTAKNRLLLAETEVERLSSILETRNKVALNRSGEAPQTVTPVRTVLSSPNRELSSSDDMPIATVTATKANLRVGPSLSDSPLMTVSKGTRLVVEKRLRDWYRIITPTGTRAWIASEVVAFGPDSQSSPSKTVSVKGYKVTE